jgi:ribonuclease I
LFNKNGEFWHAAHMAMQDDYLMRLYFMVHGCWPDESARYQRNGEFVRPRPAVLGECTLPEYTRQQTDEASPAYRAGFLVSSRS